MGLVEDQIKHLAAADKEADDASVYAHAMQLIGAYAVPMTLKAVIELGVLEIIDRAGAGVQLSAAEISSQISTGNPQAAHSLDRMLRLLASHSVLTCSGVESLHDGSVEKRYGLAPVCRFFTNSQDGNSLVALLPMNLAKVFQESWQELKHVVLEGVPPFKKAHGMPAFEYISKEPEFSEIFNQAMHCTSNLLIRKMLEVYTGFQGLKELVDVGGGIGITLHKIVSMYPHIKGINFDLPFVISNAPPLSGVEYVAGDMFAKVPSAEAIFMKWVLHDWNDEDCLKILKNCYKALPDNGKVIIVERLIPDSPKTDAATQTMLFADLCMLTYSEGGKERSKREFESLGREAGFSGFSVSAYFYANYVMELHK